MDDSSLESAPEESIPTVKSTAPPALGVDDGDVLLDYEADEPDEVENEKPQAQEDEDGSKLEAENGSADADESKEAIDEEGWMHSGDLGTELENGYFKVKFNKRFKLTPTPLKL